MEIFKTVLMGCGALAILGMVGCAGMVGVGSYAVDQAMTDLENDEAFQDALNEGRSTRPSNAGSSDPFSSYTGGTDDSDTTYDENGDPVGGWGDDAK